MLPPCPRLCPPRRDTRTFWATTGLFPQEIVLKLGSQSLVSRVKLITTNGSCFFFATARGMAGGQGVASHCRRDCTCGNDGMLSSALSCLCVLCLPLPSAPHHHRADRVPLALELGAAVIHWYVLYM